MGHDDMRRMEVDRMMVGLMVRRMMAIRMMRGEMMGFCDGGRLHAAGIRRLRGDVLGLGRLVGDAG